MIRGENAAAKPGLPIVWLHGWGMSSAIWGSVPVAARPGSVLLDLPGHGSRAWVPALGADVGRWADDALARAPERAIWVGWSLGGLLAMEAARRSPERVAGLLLMAATPRFIAGDGAAGGAGCGMRPEAFETFEQGVRHDLALTRQRFLALQFMGAEDARRLRGALAGRVGDAWADGDALAAGLGILRCADLREALPRWRMPVTVVLGGQDRIVPPCVAGIYRQACPRASIHVLPGAGHAPFLHAPERVAQWLDEVSTLYA